ncbi:MAG: hypothetical protein V4652_00920 [Bacteroidota bacterium]
MKNELNKLLENRIYNHEECVSKIEKIAKDYANNQIKKICDSDNLDKIIHSKSCAEARRIIRTLIQPK